jgi:hypothetical protein
MMKMSVVPDTGSIKKVAALDDGKHSKGYSKIGLR